MKRGLVSIIIPVFNGADFVGAAIESALAQTWPDIEVIVVDDGSDDGGATQRVIARFGDMVRPVVQPNGGVGAALNTGIAAMRGEWFAWLSHDDLYHPERIARHATIALARSAPVVTFGDVDAISEGGALLARQCHTRGFEDDGAVGNGIWAVLEGRLNGCAMLIPRRAVEEAGGFDPALPTTQDYMLWHRLALHLPFVPVPGALVRQRMHEAQGSRAARHLEEASLLWMTLLEDLERMGGTRQQRLRRLRRADAVLRYGSYGGARLFMERRVRALLEEVPVDLVLQGAGSAGVVADALHRLDEAGARVADLTLIDERGPAEGGALPELLRIGRPARQVRRGPQPAPELALECAASGGGAEIVVLLDAADPPPAGQLREALWAVASGTHQGWLGRSARHEGVANAVLDRFALSANRTETGSVIAALGRLERLAGPDELPSAPPLPRVDPATAAGALAPVASLAGLRRKRDRQLPTHLLLLHGWGGGTLRYVQTLAGLIGDRVNLLYGWGEDDRAFHLSSVAPDRSERMWDISAGIDEVVAELAAYGIDRVDVLHSIGFDRWIESFLDALGVPFDVTLLDYHLVANGPHLTDERGRFVGDVALADPAHPARWAGPPRLLLRAAERRIACSRDLAWRAGRLMGSLPILAAYLPEPGRPRHFAVHAPPVLDGERLRVLCLGRLARHKGQDEIIGVARHIAHEGREIEIFCVGEDHTAMPAGLQQSGVLQVLGGFAENALNLVVGEIRPHLAWLPFTAPETFSFSVSDCMLQGLPILATGIGAIPERLEKRPFTWLLPPEEAEPAGVATFLERLRREKLRTPPKWLKTGHLPPVVPNFYEHAYLS